MDTETRIGMIEDTAWMLGDKWSNPSMYEYVVRLLRKGEIRRAARYSGREYKRLVKEA